MAIPKSDFQRIQRALTFTKGEPPWPRGIPRPKITPGCECVLCDWGGWGYKSQLDAFQNAGKDGKHGCGPRSHQDPV